MMNRPPTVRLSASPSIDSVTSRIWTAATYRSSVRPLGTSPGIGPHQSGDAARISTLGPDRTRSGWPIFQSSVVANDRVGGMSTGLPIGAPLSTHFAIVAISASLSDGSFLKCWMPIVLSTYHGGITPDRGPSPVRTLIERAHGPTSSYVTT